MDLAEASRIESQRKIHPNDRLSTVTSIVLPEENLLAMTLAQLYRENQMIKR